MPEHHRKFSPQFKAEAVQMVISTGRPIAEVGLRRRGRLVGVVVTPAIS
jgi:transposase-like protein